MASVNRIMHTHARDEFVDLWRHAARSQQNKRHLSGERESIALTLTSSTVSKANKTSKTKLENSLIDV